MKRFIILSVFFLFTILNVSCKDDDAVDCTSKETAYINEVDAPATAKVGEPVAIDVTFSMKNICGDFYNFKESSTEEGKIIEVEVDYVGCICGQAIIRDTQTYEFTPGSAGVYELNFRSSPTELTSIHIEVSE